MPAPCTQQHARLKQHGAVQPSSSSLPSPTLLPLASASLLGSLISADLPSSFLLTQGRPKAPLSSSHNRDLWPPSAPQPMSISGPWGTTTFVLKCSRRQSPLGLPPSREPFLSHLSPPQHSRSCPSQRSSRKGSVTSPCWTWISREIWSTRREDGWSYR